MAPDLSREVACFCSHPKNNVVCCGCWSKLWDRRWWLFNINSNNKKSDAVKNNVVCCGCWSKFWDRQWWSFNNNGNNKKSDAVIHIQDPNPDATAANIVIVEHMDYESSQSMGLASDVRDARSRGAGWLG